MADKSKIEWTEATWNPVTGCTKVSAGCKHCYAEREWKRLSGNPRSVYFGRKFSDVQTHPERLMQPLLWKKPRRIFVNSMSDLFHPALLGTDLAIDLVNPFHTDFLEQVFAVMALAKQHIFQVLTKRAVEINWFMTDKNLPARIEEKIETICGEMEWRAPDFDWPLPNVWLGVSVEDQVRANERIPSLVKMPAAVRWLSCEPLLGPVNLGGAFPCGYYCDEAVGHVDHPFWSQTNPYIDWVVIGGESGPMAREMDIVWAENLIGQCKAVDVPVFVKQLGGWPNKRGNPDEWPEELRVREWPTQAIRR